MWKCLGEETSQSSFGLGAFPVKLTCSLFETHPIEKGQCGLKLFWTDLGPVLPKERKFFLPSVNDILALSYIFYTAHDKVYGMFDI